MRSAILALAAGALGSTLAGAPPVELERVVAAIRWPTSSDVVVLTRTRVEEETRIALVSSGATLAASQPLDAAALRAGLGWLVDQLLLADEAARLQVFEGDGADGPAELQRFRARFAAPRDYQAFLQLCDLSEAELEATLRRSLRVRRYVESRVSHAAQVTESEVDAWLARHGAAQGVRDRKEARSRLSQRRVKEEVEALVLALRSRAEVRILDEALRAQGPGGDPRGAAPLPAGDGAGATGGR